MSLSSRPRSSAGATEKGAELHVKHLFKTYEARDGRRTAALEDISFRLDAGNFLSVVGPSGCGKSTLLKILAGIRGKTSGDVSLQGVPVDGPRRDIGIVFQSATLFPWRTVMENVLLPAELQGIPIDVARHDAEVLLKLVGLEGFEHHYPSELSGGMQQRAGICRALLLNPSLLLMDEPFGALDATTREYMNTELLRIWSQRAKTVVFVTHSIAEAVFLADKVVVLGARPGRVIEEITVDLPRPRDLSVMNSGEFGNYVARIRQHFGSEGHF